MRLAMHDSSPASKAVYYAVLSLSLVHRDGNSIQAAALRSKALAALHEATFAENMQAHQGHQHMAVGILLCREGVSEFSVHLE